MAVSSNKIIFGTAMGISQETIYSRYLPCIRHIFEAYVRECPHKIWPYMVQYLYFRILKLPLGQPWTAFFKTYYMYYTVLGICPIGLRGYFMLFCYGI
jgi:hypothetical protein